ncbi:MAG: winged helix-turn-helix transcriptional regulator [Colwellia sp.]|nr:winged helix-turn-helix transcriptional regulator [Colwellia sp.]
MDKLELIKINHWLFDPLKKTLTCQVNNDSTTETLEAKHATLLYCLIEQQGHIVSREKLIELVWHNRFIDDRTINATVSRLRKILGGGKDEFIKTHPKAGYSFTCPVVYIDRPTPEKIKLAKKEQTNLTLFKLYASLLTTLLLVSLWFLVTSLEKSVVVLTPDAIKVEPLTYSEGWEVKPSLSQDQSLLAFVSLLDDNADYHVTVKNMATKQTVIIEPTIETSSPFWSPNSNTLFYISYVNQQCLIKKIVVNNDLTFGSISPITSCGNEFYLPTIAISSDAQWLYYTYDESTHSPSLVKRFHFNTKHSETLTTPPSNLTNDRYISLSNDDSQLSFLRYDGEWTNSLMILTIASGELTKLNTSNHLIYSVAWTKSPDYLSFIDDLNILYLINIHNNQLTPLYQSSEVMADHVFITEEQLLLSWGDLYKANIKHLDLTASNTQLTNLITSPFKDHSADIHTNAANKTIAFVSNRSGNYQIWLQQHQQLSQLTHFTDANSYITELIFSANGEKLLFKLNGQLHVLTLTNKELIKVSHPTEKIRNAIWACNDSESIMVIGQSAGIWHAYQVNISTLVTNKAISSVIAMQANCQPQQYIVAKQNKAGLFTYDLKGNAIPNKTFFLDRSFTEHDQWAVANNTLYQLAEDGASILALELTSAAEKVISFKGESITNFTAKYNTLLINDLPPNDTFIGKITIPKISETILSQ